jgi:hypothetical protein
MAIRILGEGRVAEELRRALADAPGEMALVAGPGADPLPECPLVGVFSAYGSALEATLRFGRPAFAFSYLPPWEACTVVEFSVGPRGPDPDDVAAALAVLGKEPVRVGDAPGHVSLRVLAQLVNEAALAVAEGVAPPAQLDQAMRLGVNYPKGPVAWGRAVGFDVLLAVLERLAELHGDAYRPARLLRWWAAGADPLPEGDGPAESAGESRRSAMRPEGGSVGGGNPVR